MKNLYSSIKRPGNYYLHAFLMLIVFLLNNSLFAQNFCPNVSVLFADDFGTGTTATSHPDVISTALTYQPTGDLSAEGVYRVFNNTQQNAGWHNSPDHTGNLNGKMLLINGRGNTFYRHIINIPSGFQPGYYNIGVNFMNLNSVNNCLPGIHPIFSIDLEYQAQDNSWVALGGSTVSVPPLSTPTWIQMGSVIDLPATGNFIIQNIRLSMNDGTTAICGNDYAIDDISFAACTGGGPLPVEFSGLSARQKGSGVGISWSTSSEINNKYFDVERSSTGSSDWNVVSTTKSSGGNSSVLKKYTDYDHKPLAGINYYRIKQVDLDGSFKYSSIVNVKVNIDKTVASVITNPIITSIGIDFLSKTSQPIIITLYDISGKKIATEKWVIPTGASRMIFDKANIIQKGIYILSILDEYGLSIYNGKLVKQ